MLIHLNKTQSEIVFKALEVYERTCISTAQDKIKCRALHALSDYFYDRAREAINLQERFRPKPTKNNVSNTERSKWVNYLLTTTSHFDKL